VYRLFQALVQANIPGFEANYPGIISIVLQEVANGKLHESHQVHDKILAILSHLKQSNFGEQIQQIAQALTYETEEQQQRVQGILLRL
jgi:hypothetical protein